MRKKVYVLQVLCSKDNIFAQILENFVRTCVCVSLRFKSSVLHISFCTHMRYIFSVFGYTFLEVGYIILLVGYIFSWVEYSFLVLRQVFLVVGNTFLAVGFIVSGVRYMFSVVGYFLSVVGYIFQVLGARSSQCCQHCWALYAQ